MALGIIVIFLSLVVFVLMIFMQLSYLDKAHKTVGTGQDFLKQPETPKTLQEILKDRLSDPPTGCMWEVKKTIKHYRKLPNGGNVFDGSIDSVFAEIKLITPFGSGRVFSLPVDDDFFEHNVIYNAQVSIKEYKQRLAEIENHKKQISDEWDGVYR